MSNGRNIDALAPGDRRREAILAGHRGDAATAERLLDDSDPEVRQAALGALARIDVLTADRLAAGFLDRDPAVRRRAAELAARFPESDLLVLLADVDPTVVEMAVWACGEHESVPGAVLTRIVELTTSAEDPLVREAGAAALGAIGDRRGLPAILTACEDKPQVRRRAVLALAPFDGAEVEAAIDRAADDRDWQVRQSAEDLRRNVGP